MNKLPNAWKDRFISENVLYLDAATCRSLEDLLFEKLVHSEHINTLQNIADQKLGSKDGSALSAILDGIDYIGPLISRLAERKSALPVYAGTYASAIEEYLTLFFKRCADKGSFLVIIDTVERLPEKSYELLLRLIQCEVVCFILIKTEDTICYSKLENYLSSNSVNTDIRIAFDRPQVKLIKELGAIYGITISTVDAQEIIKETDQNIHTIIRCIREIKKLPTRTSFTDWEKAIIFILSICALPVNGNNLAEMVASCPVFALDYHEAFRNGIENLKCQNIISHDSDGWVLTNHYDPIIHEVLNNVSDQLIYKNIVYNFLLRSSNVGSARLRYQLSQDLNCTTPEDARLFLRKLVASGSDVPADVLMNAQLHKGQPDHCLLASINYCRERKYQEALEWLNAIPADKMTDSINAFKATLLNRTRNSVAAERALVASLELYGPPERQNFLGAFLISNFIHQEQLTIARDIYHKMKDLYPEAPLHGYLVRNAISAYKEYRADLYERALADFQADNDDFGYYTTLCNQGYSLLKEGMYSDGLDILQRSKMGLEEFSHSNLHIIYNNLGLAYLFVGQLENAWRYLLLALNMGQNSMPKIFSTINLACVEAIAGNTSQALNRLDAIDNEVKNHTLDRVRQKYYSNRLMVEYLRSNKDIRQLIDLAKMFPDRYFPEQTMKAIRTYQRFTGSSKPPRRERWRELFSPCGLAYWYLEPLKLLPKGII